MGKGFRAEVMGMRVVPAHPRPAVIETRSVKMRDGTVVVARRRADGSWTAEIPFEIALEVFSDD